MGAPDTHLAVTSALANAAPVAATPRSSGESEPPQLTNNKAAALTLARLKFLPQKPEFSQ